MNESIVKEINESDSNYINNFNTIYEDRGIKDLNIQGNIPVIFCVLTDNTMQQAIDRSGGKHGNKGTEAAIAAIKMAQLRKDSKF